MKAPPLDDTCPDCGERYHSCDAKRATEELTRRFLKAAVRRQAARPVHSSPPMSERPKRLKLADLKMHALARRA